MKKSFVKTASVVTSLSVAERGLGFLYRILLARLVGAEGLGAYQVALSVFAVFATLGTGGIPVTVSRLISKSKAENDSRAGASAVTAGIILCLALTVPVPLIFLCFGKPLSFLFTDSRALNVFLILSTGLAFSCLYAVIRGWFWGQKRFLTTSVLEIAEESVMVIAGVLLLRGVSSPLEGAKAAALAAVLSYLFSFSASLICFLASKGKFGSPREQWKPLFSSATPITGVRVGSTIVNSSIAVLLPAMLIRAGFSESEALKTFGVLSGMVLPVLFVPSTVIGALSLVLVPELSEDFYAGRVERLQKNILRGLNAAAIVACILVPFFAVLGREIGAIAYASNVAGEMIERSCPILLPMSLTMISTSALNSMGFEKQTFRYYFVGAAANILCICLLPKYLGGYAYVTGLAVSFVLCALLNLRLLFKKVFQGKRTGFFMRVLGMAAAVLPVALLGEFVSMIAGRFCGEILKTAIVLLVMGGASLVPLFLFYPVKKREARTRQRNAQTRRGKARATVRI